jgi:hypothetical protein
MPVQRSDDRQACGAFRAVGDGTPQLLRKEDKCHGGTHVLPAAHAASPEVQMAGFFVQLQLDVEWQRKCLVAWMVDCTRAVRMFTT